MIAAGVPAAAQAPARPASRRAAADDHRRSDRRAADLGRAALARRQPDRLPPLGRRLAGEQADHPRLARGGGHRRDDAVDHRRRRRDEPALVARRQGIAFIAKRDPATTWRRSTSCPRRAARRMRLTTHETAPTALAWMPDGKSLSSSRPRPRPPRRRRARRPRTTSTRSTRTTSSGTSGASTSVDGRPEAVAGITVRATSRWLSFELSRDGKRIAHQRAAEPLFGDAERGEVWVMDATVGAAAAHEEQRRGKPARTCRPTARRSCSCRRPTRSSRPTTTARLFVVPAAGGGARLITRRSATNRARRGRRTASPSTSSPTWACAAQLFACRRPAGAEGADRRAITAIGGWHYVAGRPSARVRRDEPTNAGDVYLTTGRAVSRSASPRLRRSRTRVPAAAR